MDDGFGWWFGLGFCKVGRVESVQYGFLLILFGFVFFANL